MSGSTSKGCINHLYNSAEEALYQKSYEHKDMLLTPGLARSGIFDVNAMNPKSDYHEHTRGGFVMESAMFNITDNLIITPISPGQLCTWRVLCIEERVVHVGDEEVLRLLVASFVSESALTDAFLRDPNLNPES
ncbi:hypothetical protein ACOSQ4_025327 [Xanthoceras sorbifolium]